MDIQINNLESANKKFEAICNQKTIEVFDL